MKLNDDNKILYERLKRAIIKNRGVKKKKKKKDFTKFKKFFKIAKIVSTITAIGLNLFGHIKVLMKKLKNIKN